MKVKSIIILAFATGLAALQLHAQEARPINLNEAVQLGVSHSGQLRLSTARIDEARAALKESEQAKLPGATVSGSYLRLTNADVNLKTKSSNSNPNNPPQEPQSAPNVSSAAYGILNLSYPIFTGGRIRYGIESSKLLVKAAELDGEQDKNSVVETIVESFINLFKAKSAVDIVTRNLESASERVKNYSRLEENGLLARNDLLKAQLQSSNAELALTDAQNNYELANFNMNILLGLPDGTRLLPDSASATQLTTIGARDEYIQAAINNRKDLNAVDVRKQSAEVGVKAIKAERIPSIALTGGYVAADIPKVITVTNAANVGE